MALVYPHKRGVFISSRSISTDEYHPAVEFITTPQWIHSLEDVLSAVEPRGYRFCPQFNRLYDYF
jgi:hypothetical protein